MPFNTQCTWQPTIRVAWCLWRFVVAPLSSRQPVYETAFDTFQYWPHFRQLLDASLVLFFFFFCRGWFPIVLLRPNFGSRNEHLQWCATSLVGASPVPCATCWAAGARLQHSLHGQHHVTGLDGNAWLEGAFLNHMHHYTFRKIVWRSLGHTVWTHLYRWVCC